MYRRPQRKQVLAKHLRAHLFTRSSVSVGGDEHFKFIQYECRMFQSTNLGHYHWQPRRTRSNGSNTLETSPGNQNLGLRQRTTSLLECYVDADFAGGWEPDQALDPRACLSGTSYVIFYANCPIIWQSKLQTTIALSTTEAEYVALLTAMRDVIYFMNLIDEMKNLGITLPGVQTPTTTYRNVR